MGRRGACGGTAGGGRSGRKDVQYTPVVAPFLRRMAAATSNKEINDCTSSAQRDEGSAGESKLSDINDHTKKKAVNHLPCDQRDMPTVTQTDIKTLETLGFAVVSEPQLHNLSPEKVLCTQTKAQGDHKAKLKALPKHNQRRIQSHTQGHVFPQSAPSIGKKRRVSSASQRKMMKCLSFVQESDEDSSGSDTQRDR